MIILSALVVISIGLFCYETVAETRRDINYRVRMDRHDKEIAKLHQRIDYYESLTGRRK